MFYTDAELVADKKDLRAWKDQFDNTIVEAGKYIDTIVNDRYGALTKYTDSINALKVRMEALKVKYTDDASEFDGYITQVDAEIQAIKDRWNAEVFDKLNA